MKMQSKIYEDCTDANTNLLNIYTALVLEAKTEAGNLADIKSG